MRRYAGEAQNTVTVYNEKLIKINYTLGGGVVTSGKGAANKSA